MRCSYQVYRPYKAEPYVSKQHRREHFRLHPMWTASNISESQMWMNKDLIVARFDGCQSPKALLLALVYDQTTIVCVAQGFLSLWFSRGDRCCSALENAAGSSVCSRCLTSCALLPWSNEVQCEMWT